MHLQPQPGNRHEFVQPGRVERRHRFPVDLEIARPEDLLGLFELAKLDQHPDLFGNHQCPQPVQPALDRHEMCFLQTGQRAGIIPFRSGQPCAHQIARRQLIHETPLPDRRQIAFDQPTCFLHFPALIADLGQRQRRQGGETGNLPVHFSSNRLGFVQKLARHVCFALRDQCGRNRRFERDRREIGTGTAQGLAQFGFQPQHIVEMIELAAGR